MTDQYDARLLLLHPDDNVFVTRAKIAAGDSLSIAGNHMAVAAAILPGFKVARTSIRPGDSIKKYGAHIGSATAHISLGDVVHTDNMKSDYIPTYTEEKITEYTSGRKIS
ncbi:UxaA family hydrolase [Aquisalinus flavus]|uniref:Hydrolase n=1 Tax=Aquisalinus flavus TaxID=1526572 RepID=A0A8J2V3D4_9PROT|nr:UxaA family hydrolase [Aquisalinus flavus]MBD0426006.1 UxaA family hydrolase [Aquisalinus flavus]UNE48402.1 hypothetical protein FF099_10255 [Aquisalinus flavus]GGD11480.1 hydrolase [Aquisalinus flavus]